MEAERDLIIIGAGAAGLSAAQYGARANLSTLVLEELASGGQALIIDNLENYPGFPEPIPGSELVKRFEDQAVRFGAVIQYSSAQSVSRRDGLFVVQTDGGSLTTRAVILATGAKHRTAGVPGEQELAGHGVSYCATCDGPFFKGRRILVVGGGDAACDEAMYLSKLAGSVLMIHRKDKFRAQKSLASRVLANPRIEVRFNAECRKIEGDTAVRGARLVENSTGREYSEEVAAVFVFVGSDPLSGLVAGMGVRIDEAGYIETDQRMQTSVPGLFAVGDVRSSPFRQIVVAAGEGAIAAHAAGQYIDEIRGEAYR